MNEASPTNQNQQPPLGGRGQTTNPQPQPPLGGRGQTPQPETRNPLTHYLDESIKHGTETFGWTHQGAQHLLSHHEHIHNTIKPNQETPEVRAHREQLIKRIKNCIEYYERLPLEGEKEGGHPL